MKLYIYTDLKNTEWLKYILDEFIYIQKAQFSIDITKEPIEDKPCIYYICKPIKIGSQYITLMNKNPTEKLGI